MKSKIGKLGALFLISGLLSSLLMACAPPAEEPGPPVTTPAFPMEVIDQAGRVVKLDRIPQRIISLAPSNTEILFALGLADRVVGVTDFCDYPPEAKEKPSIGGLMPNIEKMIALSPDLVLASSVNEKVIPRLEELGMTVFALKGKTLEEVLEGITLVGEITGQEEKASRLVAEMQNRIKAVTDKTDNLPEGQKPRVFYIVWHDPLMAPGSGTFQDDLIRKAGGINIAQELTGDYPTISLEAVLLANPQIIIVGSGHGTGKDLPFQFALNEPRLKNVDARRNDRVYAIDANLISRPGPRIVDALEELARLIHPELFGLER